MNEFRGLFLRDPFGLRGWERGVPGKRVPIRSINEANVSGSVEITNYSVERKAPQASFKFGLMSEFKDDGAIPAFRLIAAANAIIAALSVE